MFILIVNTETITVQWLFYKSEFLHRLAIIDHTVSIQIVNYIKLKMSYALQLNISFASFETIIDEMTASNGHFKAVSTPNV